MTTRCDFIGRNGDKTKQKSYNKKGPGRCHIYPFGKLPHRLLSLYGRFYGGFR